MSMGSRICITHSSTFYDFRTNNVMIDEDQLRDAGIKLNQEDDDP
jgi:hypothetical protein